MHKGLALSFCLLISGALALPENLKGFKSVCTNARFEEKGKESQTIAVRLIARMDEALKKAKITVAPDDTCQQKGTTASGQLNLYFDFFTTDDGTVYQGSLEGWLTKEGPYKDVTIWNNLYIGALDDGGGALQAADTVDTLMATFLEDWKKSHK